MADHEKTSFTLLCLSLYFLGLTTNYGVGEFIAFSFVCVVITAIWHGETQ